MYRKLGLGQHYYVIFYLFFVYNTSQSTINKYNNYQTTTNKQMASVPSSPSIVSSYSSLKTVDLGTHISSEYGEPIVHTTGGEIVCGAN